MEVHSIESTFRKNGREGYLSILQNGYSSRVVATDPYNTVNPDISNNREFISHNVTTFHHVAMYPPVHLVQKSPGMKTRLEHQRIAGNEFNYKLKNPLISLH
jgi:hypothetical protein